MDARRCAIGLLVASGTLAGHAIGYRLAGRQSWDANQAHGYIAPLTSIVVPAAIVGFIVLAIASARSVATAPVRLRVLIGLQVAFFIGQESLERIGSGHGGELHSLLADPAIILGLVAQVVVAAGLWLAVQAGRHVVRCLLRRERFKPQPSAAVALRATRIPPFLACAAPAMLRGPPHPL